MNMIFLMSLKPWYKLLGFFTSLFLRQMNIPLFCMSIKDKRLYLQAKMYYPLSNPCKILVNEYHPPTAVGPFLACTKQLS